MIMSNEENIDVLKNIDEFEERIKIRKNRQKCFLSLRIIFFSLVVVFLITYFLSPLGYVKISKLEGNYYLDSKEVLQLAGLSSKSHMLSIDEKKIEKELEKSPYIKEASIDWTPFYLNASINEIIPIAKDKDGKEVLSNGVKYENYRNLFPNYMCQVEDIHLPSMLFDLPSEISGNVVRFLENLKVLDRSHFQLLDYINITRSSDNNLFYSVYLKTPDENYLRVRTTLGIMKDVYRYEVISALIKEYQRYGDIKEKDDIHYRDAVCYMNNKTLTCAKD